MPKFTGVDRGRLRERMRIDKGMLDVVHEEMPMCTTEMPRCNSYVSHVSQV
jgi:hypothetical protein